MILKIQLFKILDSLLTEIRVASGSKNYELILLEIDQITDIIEILHGKKIIQAYLAQSQIIYSKWKDTELDGRYTEVLNEMGVLSELEHQEDTILLGEMEELLLQVISIGIGNIRQFIQEGRTTEIFSEVYHLHNVPSILITNKMNLLKYYLEVEAKQYSREAGRSERKLFKNIWRKLEKILLPRWRFLFFMK